MSLFLNKFYLGCVCVFLLSLFSSITQAQQKERVTHTTSIKAGLTGLSPSKEYAIAKTFTINFELGFLQGSVGFGGLVQDGWRVDLPLQAMAEPRLYYNLIRRSTRNKNVNANAANFFSLAVVYTSSISIGNVAASPSISLVPHWGFRRMVGNRFYFEPSIGYGVSYDVSPNSLEGWKDIASINIKFGILFAPLPKRPK
ncbi:MAG: hypothetical protein ACKOE5_07190 [Cytophagales bacterium]